MIFTPFMMKLRDKIINARGIKEISADIYIKNLSRLNGGPFSNMNWIKDHAKVDEFISNLKSDANKANYYKALSVVLGTMAGSKKFKSDYKYYSDKLTEVNAPIKERQRNNEPTERQKNNWITIDEIMEKKNKILDRLTNKFTGNSIDRWDLLLRYFIVCLYTDIEPRRNEYLNMYVVKRESQATDKQKNYLVLDTNKLIFNNYKTAKKYGQQVFDYGLADNFKTALALYLKYHPLREKDEFRLLVKYDGRPITANGITVNLNAALGKGIGASMLRHIYLTDKYGGLMSEMEKDANAMGHSVEQQKEYVKKI